MLSRWREIVIKWTLNNLPILPPWSRRRQILQNLDKFLPKPRRHITADCDVHIYGHDNIISQNLTQHTTLETRTKIIRQINKTKQIKVTVSLYFSLGIVRFDIRPGYCLSWPKFSVVFLSHSTWIPRTVYTVAYESHHCSLQHFFKNTVIIRQHIMFSTNSVFKEHTQRSHVIGILSNAL